MLFGWHSRKTVPELIAWISAICSLLPRDVIFTRTPAGVGAARTPKRFLSPGATPASHVEDLGDLPSPSV
ncbi:fumarylacetoacetate hydrolase family protein [Nocardia arthritidis]|uniref:fumarylacetoacetate hydrolase family protein n=1 Tax=Nocardia arthritidis TaxID=228602 RepID=UPI0007A420C6|nr:fumarylacetoacetate hydrolase family protein [Nocardia arthritidis]